MNHKDTIDEKKNEYGCTLFIDTNDDHPEIITKLSGLVASEMILKGSNRLTPVTKEVIVGKFNENNLWIFRIEKEYGSIGFYLNNPLEKMLDILDSQQLILIDILQNYPKNHILCHAYFYETNPYFTLDKTLIRRLSSYEIAVEFDMYCLS